ncbi:hypothetical protein [Clostridium baratii]|uniref:hypothetical protein n=1 Tax=Clostridium baratii TaxID=1561 RepID=UPI0029024996|nr:hypothetical protein [Clostridium baratii]MDU1055302.1 hypothetical protein [Clostridium baratii]
MEKIMYITDYIEGFPVVASVRYSDLMEQYNKVFDIIVINDSKYGDSNSKYSKENLKFYTGKLNFDVNNKKSNKNSFKDLFRQDWILKIWRNYKYSYGKFKRENDKNLKKIINTIESKKIKKVFITVPDVYSIYIAKYIKDVNKDVIVITEIRDILNHNIGKGNPRFIMKKAERIMLDISDGLIVLSEGIEDYYRKMDENKTIKLIKNGYNSQDFEGIDCTCKSKNEAIVLSHIGSIYKGRNIKDFIIALVEYSNEKNIKIIFNIVGFLDNEALNDLEKIDDIVKKSKVSLNIIGTVEHKEAIEYLISSDIAVILTHISGSGYAIPGKTFEYIGAEKPILAVTNDKPLVQLINHKYGECAQHNINDILEKLKIILDTSYDFQDKYKYTREFQAKEIIKFIKSY